MNAEFAKARTPLHAGGGSARAAAGVAAAARVDDQHWGASDQASRLRALVEAVARGTTAEPVFDEPEAGQETARSVAFRAPPGVGRGAGNAARRDADTGSRSPQPREIVATVEAGPVRAVRPTVPVIAIASGKGGVGKTSIAVNLAIALNQYGCRASLLDADLGLANADVLCGIVPTSRLDLVVEDQDAPAKSINDPLFDDPPPTRAMSDIAVRAPGGFLLVPGSVGVAQMTRLSDEQRASLIAGLATLESRSDLILIDTSAGLTPDVLSFVSAADATIIVATPEPTSIADAYALMKVAVTQARDAGREPPRLLLVVNQARNRAEARRVHARLSMVCDRFLATTLPLLGMVRADEEARAAVRARRPYTIASRGAACSKDVRALAGVVVARTNAPRRGTVAKAGLMRRLTGRG